MKNVSENREIFYCCSGLEGDIINNNDAKQTLKYADSDNKENIEPPGDGAASD